MGEKLTLITPDGIGKINPYYTIDLGKINPNYASGLGKIKPYYTPVVLRKHNQK
jgi:hypothetical protein